MTKKYKQITLEERTLIQTQLQQGFKPGAIAASLKRPDAGADLHVSPMAEGTSICCESKRDRSPARCTKGFATAAQVIAG